MSLNALLNSESKQTDSTRPPVSLVQFRFMEREMIFYQKLLRTSFLNSESDGERIEIKKISKDIEALEVESLPQIVELFEKGEVNDAFKQFIQLEEKWKILKERGFSYALTPQKARFV